MKGQILREIFFPLQDMDRTSIPTGKQTLDLILMIL